MEAETYSSVFQKQAYLVDYGLAFKFLSDNKHKQYKEDPRRCHDGTREFTSIDAHNGVSEFNDLIYLTLINLNS